MTMTKQIYIMNNTIITDQVECAALINADRDIKMATSDDLIEDLCIGGDPVKGCIIELQDGIFVWDYSDVDECFCYIQVD